MTAILLLLVALLCLRRPHRLSAVSLVSSSVDREPGIRSRRAQRDAGVPVGPDAVAARRSVAARADGSSSQLGPARSVRTGSVRTGSVGARSVRTGWVRAGSVHAGSVRTRVALTLAVGLLTAVAVGSVVGAGLGLLVALGCWRLLGRGDPVARGSREPIAPVLDLAVLLLRAGATPTRAFAEATALGDQRLRSVGARLGALDEMGQGARSLWSDLRDDPLLGQVAQSALRSAHSGAALADAWAAVAAAERSRARSRAEAAARRAGVRALGPLGLCFLPAFVALAVVPMVIGLLGDVLG